MHDERKKHGASWAAVVVGVLLFLSLYVGSYLVLVRADGAPPARDLPPWPRQVRYRFGEEHAVKFFWPVHVIDRQMRRNVWGSLQDHKAP